MFVQQGRAAKLSGNRREKKNGISNAIVFPYPGIFIFQGFNAGIMGLTQIREAKDWSMLHFKGSDFVAIDLNKFDGQSVDYSASQSIGQSVSQSVI